MKLSVFFIINIVEIENHCTTMRDRKDVWIYLFVYCIDNLIKGYSNYFYISMKNLRSDINVEINTPREH